MFKKISIFFQNLKGKLANLSQTKKILLVLVVVMILTPTSYVLAYKTAERIYLEKLTKDQIVIDQNMSKENQGELPAISEAATTPEDNQSSVKKKSSASQSSSQNETVDSSSGSNGNSSDASNNSNSSGNQNSSDSSSNSNLPSCGSNYTFFDTSPLGQSDFNGLVPLGNLNPSGHTFPTDHIYFYLTNPLARFSLYAPGNATITQIDASEHVEDGFTDYSFTFQPCSEFKAHFGHVSALADKLSQALSAPYSWESTYSTGGKTYRMYGKMVNVTIGAGEQIGTVGGNAGQNALDMNAYDTRVTLNFANSSRWSQRSDTTHTVCPINYYSGDLKNTLVNRLGDYDGAPKRTIEPVCGTIEQDVAETAQGVWFVSGTSNSWSGEDPHLALVHNNIDPSKAVFSVGTSTNIGTGTYEFSPQSSGLVNRDFDDIRSDGNTYCFEPLYLEGSKIILQLPTPTTLKIEKQTNSCGSGPWSFTSNVSEFER